MNYIDRRVKNEKFATIKKRVESVLFKKGKKRRFYVQILDPIGSRILFEKSYIYVPNQTEYDNSRSTRCNIVEYYK